MDADTLETLNLWLAGRSYRIRVKPEDKERILLAVKGADDKVNELRLNYAGKDDQDFLAMCVLMYAAESNGSDSISLAANIKYLNEEIDKALE